MFLGSDLSGVFLISRPRLWILGEEDCRDEAPFSSRYIKGTYYQHDITFDVDLDHLAKVVLDPAQVKLIPSFHTVLLEGSHYRQLTFKDWGVMLHLPEGRVSTQIIWNSPAWEIYLFSLIYLIIQLFIHSSMDLWIFILYFWL